jgi:NAD+ kinase
MTTPIFKTLALFTKPQHQASIMVLGEVADFLLQQGCHIVVEQDAHDAHDELRQFDALPMHQMGQRIDAAIIIGGDGTMCGIARQLAPFNTPLIGINMGTLGFMTDIPSVDKLSALEAILAGHYVPEQRSLLDTHLIRNGQSVWQALALNDVVVSRGGIGGMTELRVSVDQQFMYDVRADGLIVATPTGSTAYALAANGPILHPRLQGMVLVPIAPHALSNRPITLPDDCILEIEVMGHRETHLHFDMQSYKGLQPKDCVVVKRSRYTSYFLHPQGYDYFGMLREKLHWSGTT